MTPELADRKILALEQQLEAQAAELARVSEKMQSWRVLIAELCGHSVTDPLLNVIDPVELVQRKVAQLHLDAQVADRAKWDELNHQTERLNQALTQCASLQTEVAQLQGKVKAYEGGALHDELVAQAQYIEQVQADRDRLADELLDMTQLAYTNAAEYEKGMLREKALQADLTACRAALAKCLYCIEVQNMPSWNECNTVEEAIAQGYWCDMAIEARRLARAAVPSAQREGEG